MRRFLIFIFAQIVFVAVSAQTTIESDSYGLDQYLEKCTDIPVIRDINGGTVFKITYEPEEAWNNAMRGAFEYACKIWEEQLPNTLPINICAKIGTIRGNGTGNLLSRVMPTSYNFDDGQENLSSRIKFVLLSEYNTGYNVTFVDSINSTDFFEKPDITIVYNKSMIDNFSFSLYSTPVDKYDFVTVVLRDIAKGLGFVTGFTADTSIGAFHKTVKDKTYYEEKVQEAIGTNDVYTAYTNSTKGTLTLSVPDYGDLYLYAPSKWQNGVSLNYFVPDSTKRISELLTYDLGRGSVIRNITDEYNTLFGYLQGWQNYNLVTGYNPRNVSSEGDSKNIIEYNGDITLSQSSTTSANDIDNEYNLSDGNTAMQLSSEDGIDLNSYLFPYDYKYPDEDGAGSWIISLLKKDGTWDPVYREYTGSYDDPLSVNMSDLDISSDYEQYQRTCDGYIRCRITHYKKEYDVLYHKSMYNISNHYYVLDYLPQKVKMGFNSTNTAATAAIDDEYTQTIEININGLEGVDRIIVEQLDEGNDMPLKIEVPDFKKGYFTATVDKELYTQFVVYSYNKNGTAKSETLTIDPLSPAQELYSVLIDNNSIALTRTRTKAANGNTSYVIYSNAITNATAVKKGMVDSSTNSINISDLKKGNYILRVC
jgi:hypothetical protein